MKTLYKFGYKLDNDSSKWITQVGEIFSVDLSNFEIEMVFESNQKTWYNTVKIILENTNFPIFLGNNIVKVVPNYNRYQEYVYLSIIFEGDLTNEPLILNHFRNRISKYVSNFVDNFEIPFKEMDVYNQYENEKHYNERVDLGNPALIAHTFEDHSFLHFKGNNIEIYYAYKYNNEGNNKYLRGLKQIYIHNEVNTLDDIVLHFHSVFIMFHRASNFYHEIKSIDNPSKVIAKLSGKLNTLWPKERINLFLLNRFLNAGLYNKTFFGILELNAQMNSILSQLRIRQQVVKDKYDKQFERVLFNFEEEDILEIPYYIRLKEYLYSPYVHRQQLLDRIQGFFEPTDVQIERLRNDNDSKVSFAIQWIMSILSVIVFFWGIVTVWYENTIQTNIEVVDAFYNGYKLMPYYLSVIIMSTILCAISAVIYFLIHNSSTINHVTRRLIKSKKIKVSLIEKLVDKINDLSMINKKKRLYYITEMFKLITTHVILNIDDECTDVEELIVQVERLNL